MLVLLSYSVLQSHFISVFFFFKQKTAYEMRISDWSSDVCSSDLVAEIVRVRRRQRSPMACRVGQLAAARARHHDRFDQARTTAVQHCRFRPNGSQTRPK